VSGLGRRKRTRLELVLSIFGDVHPGEGRSALLLGLNVFVLLIAYYLLKTVREPLILLSGLGDLPGDELKIYSAAAQAGLLFFVLPIYARFAGTMERVRFIRLTLMTIVATLGLFIVLAKLGVPIGIVFYLWLGIVGLLAVAQFWSYANDIHTRAEGERLFAIVAIGGSAGAIVGAQLARWLIEPLGVHRLMALAAGLYAVCLLLVDLIEQAKRHPAPHIVEDPAAKPRPGAFGLILKDRYLLMLAVMLVLANLVNTQGEYILADVVKTQAEQLAPAAREVFIGRFYANFYSVVNGVALLVQLLVVARLVKYIGVRTALFLLPLIALGGYMAIALVPTLMVVAFTKGAENSLDYSLHNTVRQMLFLPTTREIKYKAKAAIDTSFVRLGDTVAAGAVFAGIHWLHLSRSAFALLNVILIVLWVVVTLVIVRLHRRMLKDESLGPVRMSVP
jgi:AAA family ATP:ADP antiporter